MNVLSSCLSSSAVVVLGDLHLRFGLVRNRLYTEIQLTDEGFHSASINEQWHVIYPLVLEFIDNIYDTALCVSISGCFI